MTLISIEGLDGAGGTTVVEAIGDAYPDAVLTKEPTDLWTGDALRRVLSDEDSQALLDFFLFMADRVKHIDEKIRPLDEMGELVVCDRYADSTRAYQPISLVEDGAFESQWHAKAFIEKCMGPWIYEPDATLYIDVSVETAVERADCDEKFEVRDFLREVKRHYTGLAQEKDRFIRIDGEQSNDAVKADALEAVDNVLNRKT